MDQQHHVGSSFKPPYHSTERQACSQCRWRKVRCDKRRGICANCERLNMPCSFSASTLTLDVQVEDDSTLPIHLGKPPRLRGSRACVPCRKKKIRCSATLPSCSGCRQHPRTCIYEPLKPRTSTSVRNHDGGSPSESQIPSADQQGRFNPAAEPEPEPEPVSAPVSGVSSSPSARPHPPSPQSPQPQCWMSYQTRHADNQPGGPGPDVAQGALTDEFLLRLVDVFFDSIYPMPSYSFLHSQTTKRLCLNGGVRNELISAVCAITALYLGGEHGIAVSADTAASWIQAAEQSVWQYLECPTIPRLQTLMLVIHYHMETSRFQRAFMLMATAARFAAAMSLNHERPDLDPVAREVRRRILWSLKIIERYFSSGLAEFDLLPLEVIYIDFPHSENAFTSGSQEIDELTRQDQYEELDHIRGGKKSDDEEGGAYRLLVQLESVRRDIMKLTRSIALVDNELPSLSDLIRHHEQTLAAVELPATLPDGVDIRVTAENNATAVTDPDQDRWLPRRVLAHVSWHQAHCDLYRILLPGYPEAAPAPALKGVSDIALAAAEHQCLHHAMGILQIITALNQNSTRHHLLEFDTAICAYHAARLVLFISHFGKGIDRPTPEYAASRVDLCLAALKRFFPSSALVVPIIQELGRSLKVFSEQEMNRHRNPRPCCVRPAGNRQTPPVYETPTSPGAHPPSSVGDQVRDPQHQHQYQHENTRDDGEGHAGKEKLSAAARAHQRLAIHSLLRRADFDGDDEDENKTTTGQPTTEPSPDELQHQQQWQRRDGLAGAPAMPSEDLPIPTDPAVPLATSSHSDLQEIPGTQAMI